MSDARAKGASDERRNRRSRIDTFSTARTVGPQCTSGWHLLARGRCLLRGAQRANHCATPLRARSVCQVLWKRCVRAGIGGGALGCDRNRDNNSNSKNNDDYNRDNIDNNRNDETDTYNDNDNGTTAAAISTAASTSTAKHAVTPTPTLTQQQRRQ